MGKEPVVCNDIPIRSTSIKPIELYTLLISHEIELSFKTLIVQFSNAIISPVFNDKLFIEITLEVVVTLHVWFKHCGTDDVDCKDDARRLLPPIVSPGEIVRGKFIVLFPAAKNEKVDKEIVPSSTIETPRERRDVETEYSRGGLDQVSWFESFHVISLQVGSIDPVIPPQQLNCIVLFEDMKPVSFFHPIIELAIKDESEYSITVIVSLADAQRPEMLQLDFTRVIRKIEKSERYRKDNSLLQKKDILYL